MAALPVMLTSKSPPWNLLGLVSRPQCSRGQRDGARVGDFMQVKVLQDLPGLGRSRDKERIWLGNCRCPGKRGCTGREWVGGRGRGWSQVR